MEKKIPPTGPEKLNLEELQKLNFVNLHVKSTKFC